MDVLTNLYTRKGTDFSHTVTYLQACYLMRCSRAGTSGGSQPSWGGESDQVTVDNTVHWQTMSVASSDDYSRLPPWQANLDYREGNVVHTVPAPVDLTGYSATWSAKIDTGSAVELFSYNAAPHIVIDETAGTVALALTQAEVDVLDFQHAAYALTLTSDVGQTQLLMHGLLVHADLYRNNSRVIGPGQGTATNTRFVNPEDRRATQLLGSSTLV